ncbi:hypothetical protein MHI48_16910 [Paenibacillus sp. FSL H7-0942]|uniref:hypothetical protein n=1 Tax=Paenibacillus TaxID=44249 RepID=UPI00096D484F|nr:hypothetical protein [Paenibacillus amylolyticus]OMF05710.1 hypothetical protein BK129_17300 [Paenibacillus amylolyticus]
MNLGKELSNAYSTGGGGVHFENRVQASFVVLMLTGGFSPCLPTWPITEIKLQGKYQNFDTDDLIIYVKQSYSDRQAKLLGQIKHYVKITKGDIVFGEVIQSAWNDFNNIEVFNRDTDAIALITGPLNATDTVHVRGLLRQAEFAKDADDFIKRVTLGKFTSNQQREKLDVFKFHLNKANQDIELTDEQLWQFMKSFHLLIYDLDIKGVILSLLHSLIGQYSENRSEDLLALIEQDITYKSENAGSITLDTIPKNILSAFQEPVERKIPDDLVKPILTVEPDWNHSEFSDGLIIANFLGSWNEKNDADIEVIGQLIRGEYSKTISEQLRPIIHESESPVALNKGIWTVSRREKLWRDLGPLILDDDLERFYTFALTVLTERDPKYAHSPYGNVPRYSPYLRRGIAETLSLLGSYPEYLINCSLNKPQITSILTVRETFKNADWVLWGSLNELLPLFAEAAPEEFINAVETALQQSPCPFDKFSQEDLRINRGNYLTGLLRALETLAWNKELLVRISVILGELAINNDLSGNSANGPLNSLSNIFLPWFPQTTASIDKRKVAIKTLTREVPEVGWALLLKLLPNQQQTSTGSRKPNWRKIIPDDWNDVVNREDYWKQVSNYAEMSVDIAKNNLGRLVKLVRKLNHLPQKSLDQLIEHLSSQDITKREEDERLDIWNELTTIVLKHKRFSDAEWALKPDMVAKIEEVTKLLAPINPLNLHRILFKLRNTNQFEEKGDWEVQHQQLENRRQQAITEILEFGGISALLQFVKTVESPSNVGFSLGMIGVESADSVILPDLLTVNDKTLSQFAASFVWGRYCSGGSKWVDTISKFEWTPAQIGQFFSLLPFMEETWIRAEALLIDHEVEYWSRVDTNLYQRDSGDFRIAVEKLIDYGRPNSAVEFLSGMLYYQQPLEKTNIIKALNSAVSSNEGYSADTHNIVDLIKVLQDDPDTNEEELFQIEWSYLPLLNKYNNAQPRVLENRLASNSDFFCEVIRLIYRSNNEKSVDQEPSDNQKALAENAYRLLGVWKTVPGTDRDGKFSIENFNAWLKQTKETCAETGHLEVALLHLGNVLIYSPQDSNGLWIDQNVAEALNEKDAEHIRQGFRISELNSRGAHWVDPTGEAERELANGYRQRAEEIEDYGFHRFAVVLRSIAESYDQEAERSITESVRGFRD